MVLKMRDLRIMIKLEAREGINLGYNELYSNDKYIGTIYHQVELFTPLIVEAVNKLEEDTVARIYQMGTESLSPDTMKKLDDVLAELRHNRKALKVK